LGELLAFHQALQALLELGLQATFWDVGELVTDVLVDGDSAGLLLVALSDVL